ncbi:unnamed protein product [Hermetia illucens]|uniref:C2H2-type domain-containing protein n=1 Tax=Hermetia illucens TaxID=343691 RepID=A0A7R8UH12_HERIL|nr:zinc finger protein 729-like [Hermetia illucens]CAD7080464.1 unnamed protein product [Hermetia illucens]
MDLMSSCNSRLHLGIKSEDEILSELIEGNHVSSHYTDTMSNDQMANCGHILISISGEYTVVCDACKGRFDTVESFSNHLKTVHWDYAVRRDGLAKTTNRKEPIVKRNNVKYQECIPGDISARRTSEPPESKESITNVRQNFITKVNPGKVTLQHPDHYSKSGRKPTLVITAEPKYDERRLFCITCDRQLTSRKHFSRHKYYHKQRFRRQGTHSIDCDNHEDMTIQVPVKDELDVGDYEIQDSAYNEGRIETSDNDDNAQRGQTDSNDTLKPHFRNHGVLSENAYSVDMMKGSTGATAVKLEVVNPDEEMALSGEGIPRSGFPSQGNVTSHELLENRKIPVKRSDINKLRFSCKLCSERFKSEFELRDHAVMHHGDDMPKSFRDDQTPHEPQLCQEQFQKPTDLHAHEGNNSNEGTHKCSKRPVPTSLSQGNSFACADCGKLFSKKSELTSHRKTHVIKTDHKCEKCGELFTERLGLRRHILDKHSEACDFQCRNCEKRFKSYFFLMTHIKYTSCGEKVGQENGFHSEMHKCEKCGKVFNTKTDLEKHMTEHSIDCLVQCSASGDQSGKRSSIFPEELGDEETYSCMVCDVKFIQDSDLQLHIKSHKLESSYETVQLKKDISEDPDMQPSKCLDATSVASDHLGDTSKSEEAPACEDSSLQSGAAPPCEDSSLQGTCQPKKTIVFTLEPEYDEENNFCITCNQRLSSKETFRYHKKKHRSHIRYWKLRKGLKLDNRRTRTVFSKNPIFDNKKNFCVTCNRKFASKPSFRSHKSQHRRLIREKTLKFCCELCPRRFGTDFGLREHVVAHHGDEIPKFLQDDPTYLECRFCFREFEEPTQCYQHEQSHAGEKKPYQCPLCPETFTTHLQRKIHKLIHRKSGWKPKEEVKFVFSENPKFDDVNHFCITCHRGFASRGSLGRHKGLHTKQIIERQGNLSKDTIRCNDDDVEDVKGDANNSLDSHYFSDNSSQTSYEKIQRKSTITTDTDKAEEVANGSFVRIEPTSPEDPDQTLKPNYSGSIVFKLEPHFDEENKFCITCNRQFDSNKAFRTHKDGHKAKIRKWKITNGILPKTTISCEFCCSQFRSEDGLRKHVVKHHGDKIPTSLRDDPTYLQCRFCFKEFEKPTERYEHEKSHAREEKRYQCPFCPKSFIDHFKRKIHESLHRENRWKPKVQVRMVFSESPKFDDKKRLCITCNHEFISKHSFNVHKRRHRMKIREKQGMLQKVTTYCELCSREFKSENGLRRHLVPNHGDKIPTFLKNDPTYLQCKFCFKQFEKPTERYQHEKSHPREERPYKCSLCPQSFTTLSNRKTHESLHREAIRKPKERRNFVFSENPKIDDKKRFCITCNSGFTSKSSLNNHKQKHRMRIREKQGNLPNSTVRCEFCPRQFRSEIGLREHIVPHHGDKIPSSLKDDPSYLQCRFCHSRFDRPTERHQHEKIHANEQKPYQCSTCSKSFGTGTERKTHEAIHKEDRPFRCSQCSCSYKIASSLSRHVRNAHSGIKPIIYGTFGEPDDSKSNLTSHKLTNTKDKDCELQSDKQPLELRTNCEKMQLETDGVASVVQ